MMESSTTTYIYEEETILEISIIGIGSDFCITETFVRFCEGI